MKVPKRQLAAVLLSGLAVVGCAGVGPEPHLPAADSLTTPQRVTPETVSAAGTETKALSGTWSAGERSARVRILPSGVPTRTPDPAPSPAPMLGIVQHAAYAHDSADTPPEPPRPFSPQAEQPRTLPQAFSRTAFPRQQASSTRAVSHNEALTLPRTIENALNPPTTVSVAVEPSVGTELDLTGALALVGGQSPRIAFAAARYREAYARLESARTLWLPSIRAGMSYHHHDGNLQASDGTIASVSRSSLQSGMGVNAVGAGTTVVPGVVAQFHTTDAIFQPQIMAHEVSARKHARRTVTNDTLLDTALAYLNLLRTVQGERIAQETRDGAQKLADLTTQFARSGQGPQADADRARTELVRRRIDVSRADEEARVASARLAELLSLDPAEPILPQEPTIVPIELVPTDTPLPELVSTGLMNRPELAESRHLVCEAVYRYRREKYAPLVPSVLLGVSQSGFGGGLGSTVNNVDSRFDFDAAVFWELRNLGFGERAQRDRTRAGYDQARAEQARVMDSIAREVVEAATQVESRVLQIEVAESGVDAATKSYERNLSRIREGQGLPIEALQSLQALDESRREYLRTLVDYNEAQFRLQRALGWPIQ